MGNRSGSLPNTDAIISDGTQKSQWQRVGGGHNFDILRNVQTQL